MKHHALVESDLAVRIWSGSVRGWVVLTLVLGGGGCLDDVNVPDCVREHNCSASSQGGKPSQGGKGNSAGVASEAGADASSPAGGAPPIAGRGGDAGDESEGGVAGDDGQAGGSSEGGESGTECLRCLIREDNLPPPCTGKGYEAKLSVQDGDAPFSWQVWASRPGWSITATADAEAKLENPSPAPGLTRLTVTAMSSTGERTTKSFELESRDACWFAFTRAGDSGAGELLLFDPLATRPEAAALAHGDQVFDFAFSPDGQRLAYSYGPSPERPRGAHLSLLDLRTLEEEPLSFGEDAVWAFAWSPDGSMLAASYESEGQGYLGAARMASAPAASKAALAPTTAFVTTELSWLGNRAVAYHAPVFPDLAHPGTFMGGSDNPSGLRTAFWAELDQTGFAAPGYGLETFPPDVNLRASSEGFYMLAGSAPRTIFYAPFESPPYAATRGDISLVSPSGRYAARFAPVTGERLRVDAATGALDASVVSSAACPLLLAWSPAAERLACVADVWNEDGTTKHGELRLFTLDVLAGTLPMLPVSGACSDDVSTLTPSSCARRLTDYAYSTDLARKTARGFSSTGRYFAYVSVFDSETFLYLVDLQAGPAALTEALYISRPSMTNFVTRLSFSPDERLLLLQLGSELTLIDVATGKERSVLSNQLMPTSKCTEDFAQAPNDYCGSTERAAPWLWAADSKKLAYRTADSLTVVDASAPFSARQVRIKAQACDGKCSDRFEFQPLLP